MYAINVNNVSKWFRRTKATTIKEFVVKGLWKKEPSAPGLVWALKDVDFGVKRGATFAVIGQNGSGKSTLLKILAGILRPDAGSVSVSGRISALIELGAGFHPEFTGRENIYINGMLLGLTKKEIRKKTDGIIEFSGLRDFIDEPVRTYSSGMYSKLGFSVAVNIDPDVLLIDEVFAVGDEEFVHKCKSKMDEFKRRGKTILFVTHSLQTVEQWCDDAVWLRYGIVKAAGKNEALSSYRQEIFASESSSLLKQNEMVRDELSSKDEAPAEAPEPVDEAEVIDSGKRWGTREVEITSVRLLDSEGRERYGFHTGEMFTIEIAFKAHKPVADPVCGFAILTGDGLWCYGTNTYIEDIRINGITGEGTARVTLEKVELLSGAYFLNVAVSTKDGHVYDYHNQLYRISVTSDRNDVGIFRFRHRWEFKDGFSVEQGQTGGGG